MPSIASRRDTNRSPLGLLATIVRIPLYAILAGLAFLALSEIPPFAGWLSGIGGPLGGEAAHVVLVAGHWQNDAGAVCPDGLQEVDVNLAVAREAAALLRGAGYSAEVIPEYSPKLVGLRAMAFVAIHADSCLGGLSGYKVAHYAEADPLGPAGLLAASLSRAYADSTGLAPHPNTITDDMRRYHGLRKIAPDTPGVIIECGFLGGDRRVLTEHRDLVAQGIADGIIAFLETNAADADRS